MSETGTGDFVSDGTDNRMPETSATVFVGPTITMELDTWNDSQREIAALRTENADLRKKLEEAEKRARQWAGIAGQRFDENDELKVNLQIATLELDKARSILSGEEAYSAILESELSSLRRETVRVDVLLRWMRLHYDKKMSDLEDLLRARAERGKP